MCTVWRGLISVAWPFLDKELIVSSMVLTWWLLWTASCPCPQWTARFELSYRLCSSESFSLFIGSCLVLSECRDCGGEWRKPQGHLSALTWLFPHPCRGYTQLLQFWVWTGRDGDRQWSTWAHGAKKKDHTESLPQSLTTIHSPPPPWQLCAFNVQQRHPLFPAVFI